MTLTEFYDEVARNADTEKTKIGVADTKRVLSEAFRVLAELDSCCAFELVSKGLHRARSKQK